MSDNEDYEDNDFDRDNDDSESISNSESEEYDEYNEEGEKKSTKPKPTKKQKQIKKFLANERLKSLKIVNKVKKPLSAYLFFTAHQRPIVKAAYPNKLFTDISRTLGDMWREQYSDDIQKYKDMAVNNMTEYHRACTGSKDVYKTCAEVCLERSNCKLVEISIFGSNVCPSIYKYLVDPNDFVRSRVYPD